MSVPGVLVDNGARVNPVMPAYVHQHKLGVHPISELDHTVNPFRDCIPLVGLGGGWAEPLGFTLMRVQIEDMPHYDEQQVVFVLDDPSGFSTRIPVILGTPTINRVMQTVVISVIVEDVEDIADMPIGRNAIFVEDVEDVKDKTLPGCQADILFRIELIPSFVLSSDNTNYNNVI